MPALINFEISEKKAIELARRMKVNETIVLVGVYLMDIKLGEASAQNKNQEHVKMSVEATQGFLTRFDLNEEEKMKIINCVEAHHGQVPFTCKEAEICANADCYRFIHPKGFFLCLTTLGKRNLKFVEALDFA
ncbi:MAG: hypothetical protein NTY61_01030 [Candidatus Parcubacteria bacterium]|nr:hypothetical protein [Candidatus Parcubacteria bacterium]